MPSVDLRAAEFYSADSINLMAYVGRTREELRWSVPANGNGDLIKLTLN